MHTVGIGLTKYFEQKILEVDLYARLTRILQFTVPKSNV